MSLSLYRLSARQWAQQLAAWVAFALAVFVIVSNSVPPAGAEPNRAVAPETLERLSYANPAVAAGLQSRLVIHNIKPLDLSKLEETAFGDVAEVQDGR